LTGGDPEEQRITDLTGRTGHCDIHGSRHACEITADAERVIS
jgi:hypothetical protein